MAQFRYRPSTSIIRPTRSSDKTYSLISSDSKLVKNAGQTKVLELHDVTNNSVVVKH